MSHKNNKSITACSCCSFSRGEALITFFRSAACHDGYSLHFGQKMFNLWLRDIGIIELQRQSHRISLFDATDASGQKEKAKPITPASIESTSEAGRKLTRN
jgi:hypothetical protein